MTDTTFHIDRSELTRVFNPRAARQFEDMQQRVSEAADTTQANVDATTTLKDATFITLSPNAELPNERVLSLGTGLRFVLTEGGVAILSDAPQISGGHPITFNVAGPTNLVLPLTGVVATRDWLTSQGVGTAGGPFADDAAAAAGGVAVGEIYRRGTGLAARLV